MQVSVKLNITTGICFILQQSMASSNMDLNQAESFLALQVKKRDSALTESQAKMYLKVWKAQRSHIHDSLVQRCVWGNTLKNLSWRIDVKSRAKHIDQINTPCAIVEMQLDNKQDRSKVSTS